LVVGVGRATRLLRFLGEFPKLYDGTGVLGVETTTLDAAGDVVHQSPVKVTESELREAMEALVGDIDQRPPAFSAVKVEGERLYRAARLGREVQTPSRRVHVFAFTLRRFRPPRFEFRVRCSGGTYVRSLVAEVGAHLGCGAHLAALRRTAIGPFRVEGGTSPGAPGPLLPTETAVAHLSAVTLDENEAAAAGHGSILGPSGITGPYRVLGPDGRLIGIYRDRGARAVPEVILAPA